MTSEEYFTLVGITSDGKANYERFRINPTLVDDTAISSSNIGDLFAVEGNAVATVALASNVISITQSAIANCCAVIISKKTTSGYIHNEAILGSVTGIDYNADAALPTYPVGTQDYLNGGDIFGQSESFNPAPTPSPSVSAPVISGTTPFESSTSVSMTAESGAEIRYTLDGSTPTSSSTLYSAAITLSATTTVKAIAIKDGVTSSVATQVFTKSEQPSGDITITVDGVAKNIDDQVTITSSATVVVTLPSDSSLIGKHVGLIDDSSYFPSDATLVAGANTFTVESSGLGTITQGWGAGELVQEGFSQAFQLTQRFLYFKNA